MGKSTLVFSDTCLCCGAVVPEGTQVCSFCMKQGGLYKKKEKKNGQKRKMFFTKMSDLHIEE